jgi:hypothetical protein
VKLFICGHGRHGKDTVGNMLKQWYGLKAVDSSWFMAETVVKPYLSKLGLEYETTEACYLDRHNHRQHWFDAISAYNGDDPTLLSRAIFATNDIYVGIRNRNEFLKSKHISDLAIWVDASKRLGPDPTCQILMEDCDIVIDNNGTKFQLTNRVARLGDALFKTG